MQKKKCRRELTKKLLNIGLNDPKGFWNIINQMNNWGKEKRTKLTKLNPLLGKSTSTNFLMRMKKTQRDSLTKFYLTLSPHSAPY